MIKSAKIRIIITALAIVCGLSFLFTVGILNGQKKVHTPLDPNLQNAPVMQQLNGSGTKNDPYIIDSLEALCLFRDNVNSGHRYFKDYILQTTDIDMSSIDNWTPIGIYGGGNHFYGYYNGDGHKLLNLTIHAPDEFVGLFGELGGTVVNLGIESGSVQGVCVGAFASHSIGGEALIANCYNKASVSGYRVGGIADNFTSGTIYNCLNMGEISPGGGGIVGYNGQVIDCFSTTANVLHPDFIGNATDPFGTHWRYTGWENKNLQDAVKALNNNLDEVAMNMLDGVNCNKWKIADGTVSFGNAVNLYLLKFILFSIVGVAILFIINLFYLSKPTEGTVQIIGNTWKSRWGCRLQRAFATIRSLGKLQFAFVVMAQMALLFSIVTILCGHTDSVYAFVYGRGIGTLGDFYAPLETMRTSGISMWQYYEKTGDIYPPIANLVFSLIGVLLPQKFKTASSFFWGSVSLTLFILLVLLWAIGMYHLLHRKIQISKYRAFICMAILFSAPLFYMVERGNILLLCFMLLAFYLFYYDSESRVMSELALIALALAAALKIYPAILGLLLIREKRYKQTKRCIIYGVIAFLAPFALYGGLGGLITYFKNLTAYSGGHETITVDYLMSYNNIGRNIMQLFGFNENVIRFLVPATLIVFVLVLIGYTIFTKKTWKAAMALMMVLVLLPGVNPYYLLAFYALPLILLLMEKKHTTSDVFYLVFLSMCILPFQCLMGILRIDENSLTQLYASSQLVLLMGIIAETIFMLITFIQKCRLKHQNQAIENSCN